MEKHRALIEKLVAQPPFPVSADEIEVIETHISSVLLTGDYAYKFKKPVDFGFLNFTSLDARKHFCEEELRLNSRLAPSIYLEVVTITGTPENPSINGEGEAFEYAVKMRQFDQSELLDQKQKAGELTADLINDIAVQMAEFHQTAATAAADSVFGKPSSIYAPMEQNFRQLEELISDEDKLAQLVRIENWTKNTFGELSELLDSRGKDGAIRECHGDIHLGNITLLDGQVTIFDGIEFNDEFRWIDVMSELAFITMDLIDRGEVELANLLVNQYLEKSGDYAGVPLLRFYQVYRAMVRAKIASFRLADPHLDEATRTEVLTQYQSYADLAERFASNSAPQLILMHGVSASGKSTISNVIAQKLGAIRIRSDVERKRLFNALETTSADDIESGIYSQEASETTYEHLLTSTQTLLQSGLSVVVDAAFLKYDQRYPFLQMAADHNLNFHVVNNECDVSTLRQRLADRKNDVSDADESVLEHQLKVVQTPRNDEQIITLNGDLPLDVDQLISRLTT